MPGTKKPGPVASGNRAFGEINVKHLTMAADGGNSNLFGWTEWPASTEPHYPFEPGFKAYGTSQEAAAAIAPIAKNLRDRVLTLIQSLGADEALTADQIAIRLQRSPLSIRPRVSELAALGKITRTTDRAKNESGMTASKWRAA